MFKILITETKTRKVYKQLKTKQILLTYSLVNFGKYMGLACQVLI